MFRASFFCLLLLLMTNGHIAAQSTVGRDKESYYIDEAPGIKAPELTITQTTAVFALRSLNSHIGNLTSGEKVKLLALHPRAVLVSGRVEGWVRPDAVSTIEESFIDEVRGAIETERRFQLAVKNKNVIPGMSFEHVQKIHGSPSNQSSHVDASGRFDTWLYELFRREPVQSTVYDPLTGRYFQTVRYIEVPDGFIEVNFFDGLVTSIQTNRLSPQRRSNIRR